MTLGASARHSTSFPGISHSSAGQTSQQAVYHSAVVVLICSGSVERCSAVVVLRDVVICSLFIVNLIYHESWLLFKSDFLAAQDADL